MSSPAQSFPDGVVTTTLTGQYIDPEGNPLAGTVTFALPWVLTLKNAHTISAYPAQVTLDDTGAFSVELISTDNEGMSPFQWTYEVTERLTSNVAIPGHPVRQYAIYLPMSPSTVDISELAPVSPTGGRYLPAYGPPGPPGQDGAPGAAGAPGPQGNPTTVNGKTGTSINLNFTDVGADQAGAAATAQAAAEAYTDTAVSGEVARANGAYLSKSANLGDVPSPATARTNLGLGTAATAAASAFDSAGSASSAQTAAQAYTDGKITAEVSRANTAYPTKANNLSDLASVASARTNLGLGSAALANTTAFDAAGAAAAAQTFATSADTAVLAAAEAYTDTHAASNPWVFDVVKHGSAKGDGQWVIDASVTSGSQVLTSATAAFTTAVNGQSFLLHGASASGDALVGTLAYLSATTVTLSVAAGASVSAATFLWGTDDTLAFRQCVNDGAAYGLLHSYMFEVYVPVPPTGRFYVIAGALATGGATLGCAQIPLPLMGRTGPKMTCKWRHAGSSAGVQFWAQTAPNFTGATIVSFGLFANQTAQGNIIGSDGNPALIGGPTQPHGYGQSDQFSNFYLDFSGSILVTHSKTGLSYCGLDLSGIANAQVADTLVQSTGSVARNDYTGFTNFGNGFSIGILMPADGNNDLSMIRNVTIGGGFAFGLYATEHTDIYGLRILYSWAALGVVGNYYSSVGAVHSVTGTLISIEACTILVLVVGKGSGGVGPTMYLKIDTETSLPRFSDRNSGNDMGAAQGTVTLGGSFTRSGLVLDGPPGFDIVDAHGTATSVTASGTVSYLDELMLIDATSASITETLPTAVSFPPRKRFIFKRRDNTPGNSVTLATTGGQTIDGTSTMTMPTQWQTVTLAAEGGTWYSV